MFCNRCGAPVKDNAAFCAQCGNKLNYQNLTPNQSGVSNQSFTPNQNNVPNQAPAYSQGYAPNQQYASNNHYTRTPAIKPKKSSALAITFSIVGFLVFAAIVVFALNALLGGESPVASRSPSAAASPSVSRAAATPSPSPEPTEFVLSDSELIDYFCEVAMNAEYGSSGNGVIKRWGKSIRVQVTGDYTNEDYETLTNHIDTLNSLGVLPKISIVNSDANFFVYFVPLDQLDDVLPGYTEGNWGYFSLYWSSGYVINKAYMGIATDVTNQEDRNHLILEEFTQALGLMDDSYKYEDSIFQAKWTTTQSLMDIDYMLICMLYSDYLKPGMGEYEVRQALNKHLNDILPEAA